jgi:ABC-type transport system substrate-binding protein
MKLRAASRFILVFLASIPGCFPDPGKKSGSTSIKRLSIPVPRGIATLDPHSQGANEIVTFNALRLLYEGLVDYDAESLVDDKPHEVRIVGRIAEKWDVGSDGRSYSFKIRAGVKFPDDPCFASGEGRQVVAEDAKLSIERGLRRLIRDSAEPRGLTERLDLPPFVGLAEFASGETPTLRGIQAPSPRELIIHLERPDFTLLQFLARTCCRVVPSEAVEHYRENLARHAVGTGPYRVASLSGLLLVQNLDYWRKESDGRPLPLIQELRFVNTLEAGPRYQLFSSGEADLREIYRPFEIPHESGVSCHTVPWLNTIFVAFNFRSCHPVVREPELRKILSLAAPRPGQKHVLHTKAKGLFPPPLPGYDPALKGQHEDIEAARALLGNWPEKLRRTRTRPIRIVWSPGDMSFPREFEKALENLGLEVQVDRSDQVDFGSLLEKGQCELFRGGWIADYPDPQNFLSLFYSLSDNNRGAYNSPRFDRLFTQLRSETLPARRLELARRLEAILIEDTAGVFLRHEVQLQAVRRRVLHWHRNCTNSCNVRFYEHLDVTR